MVWLLAHNRIGLREMGSCRYGELSVVAYSKDWFIGLKIVSIELDSGCKLRLASALLKYLRKYKESNNVHIMKKFLLFKTYKSYSNIVSQIDAQKRENWF